MVQFFGAAAPPRIDQLLEIVGSALDEDEVYILISFPDSGSKVEVIVPDAPVSDTKITIAEKDI
ncbi:MAG: hypothetical protein HC888_15680 [Candidatus Competibacteraceae bacterium]|nr:hypothetical protein [Candidatus Competibacteraceae bacterium]NJO55392.1 hypothetical protein [Rhodospirillales bacterium]